MADFGCRARSNSEFRTFAEKLSAEIKDAAKGEGVAVKKEPTWREWQKQTEPLLTSSGKGSVKSREIAP